MREEIILIGGGGHCISVIDVIEQENKYHIAGIIDKKEKIGQSILNYKIIACDEELGILFKTYKYAIVTTGQIKSPDLRIRLFQILKEIGYITPFIVSPLAYVSKYASIGEGTIVMHHSLINSGAKVGDNCIINTKALIEHDAVIQNNCHISTGGIVNGGVIVKANTFFGSNATSKESIEVEGFIKAGSIVK